MNVKADNNTPASTADIAKYAASVLLAIAGIVAFYWFANLPSVLRGLLPLAGVVAAAAVFAFTAKGFATREYLSEARFELRKVIWPSKQETMRATGVIVLVVILMSLMLGLIDFLLGGGIRLLLGH